MTVEQPAPSPSETPSRTDVIGRAAATLALVEVGAGSMLHAFKIPLSGHMLALNQAFFLSRLIRVHPRMSGRRTAGAEVSSVVALLKSLSPAGKRLTPMLAISAQGIAFSAGTVLLGPGLAGAILGTVLLAAWTALQPFLVYALLYGRELIEAARYYFVKLSGALDWTLTHWLWAAGVLAGLHMTCAAAVAVLAWRLPDARVREYESKLREWSARRIPQPSQAARPGFWQAWGLALRDLLRPWFVASLLLTGIFFYFADVPASRAIWGLIRPIGMAAVIFFLLRWVRPEWISRRVKSKSLVAALRHFH